MAKLDFLCGNIVKLQRKLSRAQALMLWKGTKTEKSINSFFSSTSAGHSSADAFRVIFFSLLIFRLTEELMVKTKIIFCVVRTKLDENMTGR